MSWVAAPAAVGKTPAATTSLSPLLTPLLLRQCHHVPPGTMSAASSWDKVPPCWIRFFLRFLRSLAAARAARSLPTSSARSTDECTKVRPYAAENLVYRKRPIRSQGPRTFLYHILSQTEYGKEPSLSKLEIDPSCCSPMSRVLEC
jgi:hypothetical protein